MKVGDTARYHGGDSVQLLDARVGLFSARLHLRVVWHDETGGSSEQWVKMPVRYMHPSFLFQRVVFIPS